MRPWDPRTGDVQVIWDPRATDHDAHHAVLAERLTVALYFYDDRPDYRLYIPLGMLPRSESLRRHPGLRGVQNLPDLTRRLSPDSAPAVAACRGASC